MNKLINYSRIFLKRNSSTILTCIGAVGTIATAVLAVKATPKALKVLEEAKEEKGDELTKLDVIKVAGPAYIPTVIVGVSTITCIFGANILNKRQQASLMSAYALVDNSYKDYKKKLKELYGEEAHENIVNSVTAEKAKDSNVVAHHLCSVCDLSTDENGSNPVLFYDEYGKRYFEATIEQVITAEYHLNRNFVLRGFADLNELYEFIGIAQTEFGSAVGWAVEDDFYWIDFNHRKVELEDGLECYILEMPYGPSSEFLEYGYC